MKYLNYLILESIFIGNTYLLNNKLVKVIYVDYLTSSEVTVSYIYEDGTKSAYTDTIEDFNETFKKTSRLFKFNKKKVEKPKKANTLKKMYNLVYYNGKKKIETIKWNLNPKQAHIFKNYYSGFDKYKMGEIKLEIS